MSCTIVRQLSRAAVVAVVGVLALLAPPVALSATAATVTPAATSTVNGVLKDSDGNPLAGWTVWFIPGLNLSQAHTAMADGSGHYSIDFLTGTTWSTAISAPGESLDGTLTDAVEVGIDAFVAGSSSELDFTIPLVGVTVTVLDQDGNPLPGAGVSTPAQQGVQVGHPVQSPGGGNGTGWWPAQMATADANGRATLHLLSQFGNIEVTVSPPPSSSLEPETVTVADLTIDHSLTVHLIPPQPTVPVSGVARTSKGAPLAGWSVAFTPAGLAEHATVVTTGADGSYAAAVPQGDDTVEIYDGLSLATPEDLVRGSGLLLTGATTLDLVEPVVDVQVHVQDTAARPVSRADLFSGVVGSADSPVATGHLFAGSSGDVGAGAGTDAMSNRAGDATLEVLQTSAGMTIRGYYPGQYLDPGLVPFVPSTDQSLTITVQVCQLVPGVGSVMAPTSGTRELDIPVTLSVASPNEVTVSWSTGVISNAIPGQAPQSDYVAASGTLDFLPGQTSATIPITVNGDSTSTNEYIAVGFHDVVNAEMGGGPVHLAYGFIDAEEPTITPGLGTVSAPVSGTSEVDVPVTLSAPSADTVTVHWTTLSLTGASLAPAGDFVADSGTVTFGPGQTSATVPITVTGDSTGQAEYVVVSFSSPTNAQIGGFWGLGFGLIDPGA